jgi:hypothetical protein
MPPSPDRTPIVSPDRPTSRLAARAPSALTLPTAAFASSLEAALHAQSGTHFFFFFFFLFESNRNQNGHTNGIRRVVCARCCVVIRLVSAIIESVVDYVVR